MNKIKLRTPTNSLYPLTSNFIYTKHLYMWNISRPTFGAWQLTAINLSQEFDYNVQIQGKTNIICSSTLQKEMEANADSNGYTQLTTEPIINSNLYVLTACENLINASVNISLISQSGKTIATYSSSESNQFGTITPIRIPQEQFRILTILTLSNGSIIQRTEKHLISPTSFSIELTNQPYIVLPGETIHMNYTIKSAIQNPVTLLLQITDTLKLIRNDPLQKILTFINRTSDTYIFTLPKNFRQPWTTDLVIFALSTQNNQTKKLSYENDETVPIYLDFSTASITKTVNYFVIIIIVMSSFYCVNN